MASYPLDPAYRKMTVEEFLELEIEGRAELDDGILYMMAGGSFRHATIAANIIAALTPKLRGSGCRPVGSDFAVRTGPATLRLPDASVYCGMPLAGEQHRAKLMGDPRVVFEVLSPSTSGLDQNIKAAEYRALTGVEAIVFIDPETSRFRLVERVGPGWRDRWLPSGSELPLTSLATSLTHEEVFAD